MAPTQSSFTIGSDDQPSNDSRRNPFVTETSASEFNKRVEDAMAYWHVPGLALAIIDDNHIACRGYGSARLEQSLEKEEHSQEGQGIPVTPKTLFNCASMSKSFTAAAMALLVEDKEMKDVEWRTPVSRLCEDFVFADETMTEAISVEDVLCHRSGLPGHDQFLRGIHHSTPDNPGSVTLNLRNLPFTKPLRTQYQYSNTLYTAASHLVSVLTHTPFASFLQSRFWNPLSMSRTFLGLAAVPAPDKATVAQGYVWLRKAEKHHDIGHYPDPAGDGCGEIISNVEDWARWVHAFIHRSAILSTSSYTELTTPRILGDEDENSPFLSPIFYALGWEVYYYHGYTIIAHGGCWAGFISNMLYIPAKKWGFVTMANAYSAGSARTEFGWHLIDEMLGIKEEERFGWRAYHDNEVKEGLKVRTKEDLFPELAERDGDAEEELQTPSLHSFAGSYWHKGYRDLTMVWNEEAQYLEADFSDRSYPFWIRIKEHVYDLWYMAKIGSNETPESSGHVRCQFEVNGEGQCERVGIAMCEELDGLIWFDREGGSSA